MSWQNLPKIELHLHLDCSLSYQAVSALDPRVSREEYEREFVGPAKCTNLADFLRRAPKGFQLMQTEEALRLATEDVFGQFVQDCAVYVEIRFAPLLHTERGLTATRVVEIVEAATSRMARATGIEARLILCTLRHFSEAQSMETAALVKAFRGSLVAALDLAGDEAGYPLDAHIGAYRFAQENELHRTAHAGEGCGPASVWETLRVLRPSRIGHGTRSAEDPALVEHLKEAGIHLEICPTSNVQIIESIETWAHHPVDRLYRAGVALNINTDSRMLTPATLTGEYEGLARTFGWGAAELGRTNLMGVEAAFAEEPVKARLRERISTAYAGLA